MGSLDKTLTPAKESKIIEIPSSATIAQMENSLDNKLNAGWELNLIFDLGGKTYAVFVKKLKA